MSEPSIEIIGETQQIVVEVLVPGPAGPAGPGGGGDYDGPSLSGNEPGIQVLNHWELLQVDGGATLISEGGVVIAAQDMTWAGLPPGPFPLYLLKMSNYGLMLHENIAYGSEDNSEPDWLPVAAFGSSGMRMLKYDSDTTEFSLTTVASEEYVQGHASGAFTQEMMDANRVQKNCTTTGFEFPIGHQDSNGAQTRNFGQALLDTEESIEGLNIKFAHLLHPQRETDPESGEPVPPWPTKIIQPYQNMSVSAIGPFDLSTSDGFSAEDAIASQIDNLGNILDVSKPIALYSVDNHHITDDNPFTSEVPTVYFVAQHAIGVDQYGVAAMAVRYKDTSGANPPETEDYNLESWTPWSKVGDDARVQQMIEANAITLQGGPADGIEVGLNPGYDGSTASVSALLSYVYQAVNSIGGDGDTYIISPGGNLFKLLVDDEGNLSTVLAGA